MRQQNASVPSSFMCLLKLFLSVCQVLLPRSSSTNQLIKDSSWEGEASPLAAVAAAARDSRTPRSFAAVLGQCFPRVRANELMTASPRRHCVTETNQTEAAKDFSASTRDEFEMQTGNILPVRNTAEIRCIDTFLFLNQALPQTCGQPELQLHPRTRAGLIRAAVHQDRGDPCP